MNCVAYHRQQMGGELIPFGYATDHHKHYSVRQWKLIPANFWRQEV